MDRDQPRQDEQQQPTAVQRPDGQQVKAAQREIEAREQKPRLSPAAQPGAQRGAQQIDGRSGQDGGHLARVAQGPGRIQAKISPHRCKAKIGHPAPRQAGNGIVARLMEGTGQQGPWQDIFRIQVKQCRGSQTKAAGHLQPSPPQHPYSRKVSI